MAKTYTFKFSAIPATFGDDGSVSMHLSLMISAPSLTRECTLQEALAYWPEFSAKMPGPHAATLDMANRRDRKPPGFDAATRHPLYKREATPAAEPVTA